MLAIVTQSGTSLIDPSKFKNPASSFPVSSSLSCTTTAWSSNNSELYLVSSSSIKRYTPSEGLLEELYDGPDTISCLTVKNKNNTIFFAAANQLWSLDCAHSSEKPPSPLVPHRSPITILSLSHDGTLLASVSASAVFVHNLTLSSYTALKGLEDVKAVSSCLFHQHSRTRLLLGVGRDVVVYDATRPSSPLKTVPIPGSSSGKIVGLAASPFSKTLIAAVTCNGDVALVDLEKESGVLKTVSVKTPLTTCAFTAEGAAIYLGTESGKLMILDLRSLEKTPKSFVVGDGDCPIREIVVQKKIGSKPSLTATAKSPPQRPASIRSVSTSSSITGIKSPVRATVASKIRGGGGVTPKKKLFSPVRSPLSESKNLRLDAKLANARSPTLSRHFKSMRIQESEGEGENFDTKPRSISPVPRKSVEQGAAAQRIKPSLFSDKKAIERLGVGHPPESISGHLAAMRTRSASVLASDPKDERPSSARRITSESHTSTATERPPRRTLTLKKPEKHEPKAATNTRQAPQPRSTTPDEHDDIRDLSSPELPHEPVTPISLGKKAAKAPATSATGTAVGVLGLSTPEVARWAKADSRKGKEKAVEGKKTRFATRQDTIEELDRGSDHSDDEPAAEVVVDEERETKEQDLSVQLSPRRPTAPPPPWLQSPHRASAGGLNMNAAAQEFLRSIVHDVMYDFQREAKAEMMGLHLDLVRMGRGLRGELREVMEEWGGELKELREENKRLREENEKLRRGY